MKTILIKNQIEYFIAMSLKMGQSNIKKIATTLNVFPLDEIASALSSMNSKGMIMIHDNGEISIGQKMIKAYEIIGNGIEAEDYNGGTKSSEIGRYLGDKYSDNDEELKDSFSYISYRLVDIKNG